jgi:hypothetical protein
MLSKESINSLGDINVNIGQLAFSLEILKKNIPIVDMNQAGYKTKILFWYTDQNFIRDFSETDADETFFTPIQYYYDSTTYEKAYTNKKGYTNEYFIVNQKFGIHNV